MLPLVKNYKLLKMLYRTGFCCFFFFKDFTNDTILFLYLMFMDLHLHM